MGNQQVNLDKLDLIPIPNMDNYYVDELGTVYSTARSSQPRKLTLGVHYGRGKKKHYLRVKAGVKTYLAHRLAMAAYLARPLEVDEVVNHINGDTTDNRKGNLEAVSQRDNVQHAVVNNLYCSGSAWYEARGIAES